MIHAIVLAADPSPESSYRGLIISGVITVAVALIAAWSARAVKRRDATTTAPPAENEPQWLKDLRGENRRLRKEHDEDEEKTRKYERWLFIAGIDPDTGGRLDEQGRQRTEIHPHPAPRDETGQSSS